MTDKNYGYDLNADEADQTNMAADDETELLEETRDKFDHMEINDDHLRMEIEKVLTQIEEAYETAVDQEVYNDILKHLQKDVLDEIDRGDEDVAGENLTFVKQDIRKANTKKL